MSLSYNGSGASLRPDSGHGWKPGDSPLIGTAIVREQADLTVLSQRLLFAIGFG